MSKNKFRKLTISHMCLMHGSSNKITSAMSKYNFTLRKSGTANICGANNEAKIMHVNGDFIFNYFIWSKLK